MGQKPAKVERETMQTIVLQDTDSFTENTSKSYAVIISKCDQQMSILALKGPIPYIYGTQVWLSLCLQMS